MKQEEMISELRSLGFDYSRNDDSEFPMGKDVVLIRVKTERQFLKCVEHQIPMVINEINFGNATRKVAFVSIDFDELISRLGGDVL